MREFSSSSLVSTPIQRKTLTIFYVLDVSGSMRGQKIAQLNTALRNTISVVKTEAAKNARAQIRIAVLAFSTTCHWMNPQGPVDAEDFVWNDLSAGGMTNIAPTIDELVDKLDDTKFLRSRRGNLPVAIIFMTDGFATDDKDSIDRSLARARENPWFSHASFVGFPLGGDADRDLVEKIVGDKGNVIDVDDMEQFAQKIRWVSQSVSHGTNVNLTAQPQANEGGDSTADDDWDLSDVWL